MPQISMDRHTVQKAISRCIRKAGVLVPCLTPTEILDFATMDEAFRSRSIDWQAVADILGVSRSKVYHYYRDTYRRHQMAPISADDKECVKQQMITEYSLNKEFTRQFKDRLWDQWEPVYDFMVFNVLYNNIRIRIMQGQIGVGCLSESQYVLNQYIECLRDLRQ